MNFLQKVVQILDSVKNLDYICIILQHQHTIMNQKVFKIAHQIKEFFDNWSNALRAAWKIVKLFFGKITTLNFVKESGELRKATALAVASLQTLPYGFFRFVEQIEGGTQWRSCRLERMVF